MRFYPPIIALAVAASQVAAEEIKTMKVEVGANGDLTYSPNNFEAAVGTRVEFRFFPKNHTVTQSSFKDPCHPLDGGFFSGFIPITDSSSNTTFTIEVRDTKPIWFYCGQASHCQKGMIGAINAPSTGNTFDAFSALAMKASNSSSPPDGPVGGIMEHSDSQSRSDSASHPVTTTTGECTCAHNGWDQTATMTSTNTKAAGGPVPLPTTWADTTPPYTPTGNNEILIGTSTIPLPAASTVNANSTRVISAGNGAIESVTKGFNIWLVGILIASASVW